MPVTQIKQALGSFHVTLEPTTPRELLDALVYLGHVAIIDGRVNPAEYGDELLKSARYVGVYRNRVNDVDNRTYNVDGTYRLHGVGMAFWLGDEHGKGHVIESPIQFTGQSFANVIRGLLPPSVAEGTLHSVPGTYTGRHQWETPRKAIDYVCETMGAEWRVNGDGTLDAGTIAQLYPPRDSEAMLVKHGYGRDLRLNAYQGKIDSAEDIETYATRVVVLAEGQGSSIATGSANAANVPYKDLHGNPVKITKVVSESSTASVNATVRAQVELAAVSSTRRSLRLAVSDYDVAGTLAVGEYVWVYDPDTGLYDTSHEVIFRGQRINPARYRCVEMTWPIVDGMTVAYRDPDGVWYDLTDHVKFENQADVFITIGELPRSLTGGGGEPIGTRPNDDLSTPATPEWDTPFDTASYQDALGQTRAQVLLKWLTPLNQDGSTVLDGDHYEVRYALHPATDWQILFVAWGSNSLLIQDLAPGRDYDIGIRAVDRYGHASPWSTTQTITVSADTIAPSTPAPPTVAGSLLAIQVIHELGRASGGTYNLEPDLDHFEVHVGADAAFTPDESTLVGTLPANQGMILARMPAVGTFQIEETTTRWVKVIAVDTSGNASSPSVAASVTALLIDDAHISDLTVSKVTAGTINANWLIGASIRTAESGARVELNSGGIGAWNAGNIQTVAISGADGSFLLRSTSSGARVELDTSGLRVLNSGGTPVVDLSSSGSFTLRSAASGARVELSTSNGLQLYNSGGVNTVSLSPSGSFMLRSAASGARIQVDSDGIELYNASGVKTVDLNAADGSALFSGTIMSSLTAQKRMVINPGGIESEIRFYEEYDLGEYHYITQNVGSTHIFEIGSAWQNNSKIRLRMESNAGFELVKVNPGNIVTGGFISSYNGMDIGYANGGQISMKWDGWIDFIGKLGQPGSSGVFVRGNMVLPGGFAGASVGFGFTATGGTLYGLCSAFCVAHHVAVGFNDRTNGSISVIANVTPGVQWEVSYLMFKM